MERYLKNALSRRTRYNRCFSAGVCLLSSDQHWISLAPPSLRIPEIAGSYCTAEMICTGLSS
jgi:hypothetical protein